MMADPEKAYQNGGVQKPMFAPVSQNHKLGDDIDLSDIFSDYLAGGNEYDDPLYTWGGTSVTTHGVSADGNATQRAVAAQSPATTLAPGSLTHPDSLEGSAVGLGAQSQIAAATMPAQQVALANMGLPTGGIRTAFHVATLPPASGNVSVVMPQGGEMPSPAAKKLKIEGQAAVPLQMQPVEATEPHHISQHDVSVTTAPAQGGVAAPSGAISGRLGFSMVGGRLAIPQRTSRTSETGAAEAQMASHDSSGQQGGVGGQGGVQLPVGVGIRLGGVRGVVPAVPGQGVASLPGGKLTSPMSLAGGFPPSGPMSDQALAERRQRNREHAKRSRVRKKFMLESLQQQVRSLQEENMGLRLLVQRKLPRHAQQIIAECCSKSPLFADVDEDGQEGGSGDQKEVQLVRSDFNLIRGLSSGQQNFVLSDPRLPDNPIVYASEGFYELTGYTRDQVLGRNCRFLQGPGTDPRAVEVIRTAIANGADSSTCLLNYRADGTPFWNQFFIAALRDSENCIVNYVGVQCEVEPEASSSVLEEKVNAVLPLQGKEEE